MEYWEFYGNGGNTDEDWIGKAGSPGLTSTTNIGDTIENHIIN